MTYKEAILKRNIEAVLMYPFVMLGKIMSPFFRLKTRHKVFIFSPAADIGGSIQVNIDLCACFADAYPLVILSKRPKNNEFLPLFKKDGVRIIDLHKYVDHKALHFVNFFYRGVVASWINKADIPIIIGGESLFFYKVLPYLKKTSTRADVCHLNTWFNYSQAFIKDLDARIFSTPTLKRQMEALYEKNNVAPEYVHRLHFIDNKVNIPSSIIRFNDALSIVFIGRGAPQKRVHLVAAIARKLQEMKINIHFSFVGDVEKIINPLDYPYCTFYGNVRDKNNMEEIYRNMDVLLLTSSNEGLPIAVMETMAFGKVVVSTAVGGIPDYIVTGETGFLLENNPEEYKIIAEGVAILSQLASDKTLLEAVGKRGRLYAEEHFSGKVFCQHYKQVLFGK